MLTPQNRLIKKCQETAWTYWIHTQETLEIQADYVSIIKTLGLDKENSNPFPLLFFPASSFFEGKALLLRRGKIWGIVDQDQVISSLDFFIKLRKAQAKEDALAKEIYLVISRTHQNLLWLSLISLGLIIILLGLSFYLINAYRLGIL